MYASNALHKCGGNDESRRQRTPTGNTAHTPNKNAAKGNTLKTGPGEQMTPTLRLLTQTVNSELVELKTGGFGRQPNALPPPRSQHTKRGTPSSKLQTPKGQPTDTNDQTSKDNVRTRLQNCKQQTTNNTTTQCNDDDDDDFTTNNDKDLSTALRLYDDLTIHTTNDERRTTTTTTTTATTTTTTTT